MKVTSGAFAVGSADWLLVCSLASLWMMPTLADIHTVLV